MDEKQMSMMTSVGGVAIGLAASYAGEKFISPKIGRISGLTRILGAGLGAALAGMAVSSINDKVTKNMASGIMIGGLVKATMILLDPNDIMSRPTNLLPEKP